MNKTICVIGAAIGATLAVAAVTIAAMAIIAGAGWAVCATAAPAMCLTEGGIIGVGALAAGAIYIGGFITVVSLLFYDSCRDYWEEK